MGGGAGFEGRFEDLRLIRTSGTTRTVVTVDLKKIMRGQAPDPVLQADDIVFLPTNVHKAAIKDRGPRDATRRGQHPALHRASLGLHQLSDRAVTPPTEDSNTMATPPSKDAGLTKNKVRLAYLVSHPIQYQAPLLRRIAQEPDIELTVFFGSDFSVRDYKDEGFGVGVKWDVPLLDGYQHEFLPALRDNATVSVTSPINFGIASRLRGGKGQPRFDVLWVHGYATVNALHGMIAAKSLGIPVLLRAESWLRRSPARRSATGGEAAVLSRAAAPGRRCAAYRHAERGVLAVTISAQMFRSFLCRTRWITTTSSSAAKRRGQAEPSCRPSWGLIRRGRSSSSPRSCRRASAARTWCRPISIFLPAMAGEPDPYLVIVGDGEERAALEAQGCGQRLQRDSILRLSQSVGAAAILRPGYSFCVALAPRAVGTDRERGNERRARRDCLGRCGLPA